MALSLATDAGEIFIPGVVVQTKVQNTASNLGTTGVIALVGESENGIDLTAEEDLAVGAAYGPDQLADVQAKYGSGKLVDAYVGAVNAANDDEIQGAPAQFILCKTNVGGRASATLPNVAAGTWATLSARVPGADGSLLARLVTASVNEVIPTTGAFTYLPPIAATDIDFRVSGGAAVTYTIAAQQTPPTFVTNVNALAGVAATGGTDRGIIASVTGTIALTIVSGNQVTVTRSVAWSTTPTVGDTLFISGTSAIKGGSNQNVGSYVITAATSTTISATKLLDASGTANQLTSPIAVTAQTIASTSADAQAFAPVTIALEAGAVIDGTGKSLEISELTTATGRLSYVAYQLATTTVVTWISTSAAPTTLASASEYQPDINVSRQKDGVNEDIVAGGDVLLALGYKGTTASAVIAANVLTITVTGGAGTSPAAISLTAYSTINDLVAYLNTLTGFSAAAGTATVGQFLSTSLDTGTYTFASTQGAKNGRIKGDSFQVQKAISGSPNVQLTGTLPTTGAPAPATSVFMTGGTKGGTSDTQVAAAFTALQNVDCNFVVPLFSSDATQGIADGLTDASSTYTIAAINANLRAHVLSMSTLKQYKPRQGFASIRTTFDAARAAAANMASFRVAMCFQDVRDTSVSTGGVVQQRPWMAAVKAAGMQAAAFRKAIYGKGVQIVGAVQAAADFNPRSNSQLEKGLKSGLLMLRPVDGGGWSFVSDQTTYTKDNSFFFNSVQAVYGGDIIGRTLKLRLEKAIVGQSVVDMSRTQALTVLRSVLDQIRDDLKLIAPSNEAPLGYKDEDVKIVAPSVFVAANVFEATSLSFVKIVLAISRVTQG